MIFKIADMNHSYKCEILKWKYSKPYNVYNFPELKLNPEIVINDKYFACTNECLELVGYYCIDEEARVITNESAIYYTDDFLDMGLSMKPDLVGQGIGLSFVQFGVIFLISKYNKRIRLTVACFNERAIKVYKRAGFSEGERFMRYTQDYEYEFMIMRL